MDGREGIPDHANVNLKQADEGMRKALKDFVTAYDQNADGLIDGVEYQNMTSGLTQGLETVGGPYLLFGTAANRESKAHPFLSAQGLVQTFQDALNHGLPAGTTPPSGPPKR